MKTEFKITKDQKGNYNISIGVGKTFTARTLNGVAYALQHYFQEDLFESNWKGLPKHREHNKVCNCCPLCEVA